MPVLIYFTIVSILYPIHIWRNILYYKRIICERSTNLAYIRNLYLQRSFLECLHIQDPIDTLCAKILFIIFMYTFMVRSPSFLKIPSLYFLCFRLSLVANNPRRFQRVFIWIRIYIRIFYYMLICHSQLYSLPFYIEL